MDKTQRNELWCQLNAFIAEHGSGLFPSDKLLRDQYKSMLIPYNEGWEHLDEEGRDEHMYELYRRGFSHLFAKSGIPASEQLIERIYEHLPDGVSELDRWRCLSSTFGFDREQYMTFLANNKLADPEFLAYLAANALGPLNSDSARRILVTREAAAAIGSVSLLRDVVAGRRWSPYDTVNNALRAAALIQEENNKRNNQEIKRLQRENEQLRTRLVELGEDFLNESG